MLGVGEGFQLPLADSCIEGSDDFAVTLVS